MSTAQLKANLPPELIDYLDRAVEETKYGARSEGLSRTQLYRATFGFVRSKLTPEQFGGIANAGITGIKIDSRNHPLDSKPINLHLNEEEETYARATLSATPGLKRIKLGIASVRYAQSNLTPPQLAAFAMGTGGGDPPPPPEPTKTKPWLPWLSALILGALVITVHVLLMKAGGATTAVIEVGNAWKRVLSTPPLVRKSPLGTGRLYLGDKEQNEALDRIIGTASTNILWIVGGPLDARILTRLREAKRRSPGLKIALLAGPDARASAEIVATLDGFTCHVAKAPLGAGSYLAVDDDWILHVSSHAITSVRDPAAVDQLWAWVDETVGKDAVTITP